MSKLLFISLSGRVYFDKYGRPYLNSHMNRKNIKRYADISDELTLILRDNCHIISDEDVKGYNEFPSELAKLVVCPNPFKPIINIISPIIRRNIYKIINESVKNTDRVIIAQSTGIYANYAIKSCEEYNKPYLIIVGGFTFECDWYNGIKGKLAAPIREFSCKRNIKKAPNVLYVTQNALQNRYPTKGCQLGCSDVEIYDISKTILDKRIERIKNQPKKIIIGTAAALDVRLKGLKYVIKALAELNKKGLSNFEFQMVGLGSKKELKNLAVKLKVQDKVVFCEAKPHAEMDDWYDTVDIYIQPSYTEGLSRSIIEALSRACPLICTNVGGNVELGNELYMFLPGDSYKLSELIEKISLKENQINECKRSFEVAKKYFAYDLNIKRNSFFNVFMEIKK